MRGVWRAVVRMARLRVYNMSNGVCLHILRGHRDWVHCVVAMGGGDVVVSGGGDRTTRVWNVRSRVLIRTIDDAHSGWKRCFVAPSPEIVVSCGYGDPLIKVWSVGDGRHMSTLHGHKKLVLCMVMCDGRLISGGGDGTIKQWDINGARCVHTVEGAHDGKCVEALCTLGRYVVSLGYPHSALHVWDPTTWARVHTLPIPNVEWNRVDVLDE